MGTPADFDRYVDEHGIPDKNYPSTFALRIAEITAGPVPRYVVHPLAGADAPGDRR